MEDVYTYRPQNSSVATILLSIVMVFAISLAFFFFVIRGVGASSSESDIYLEVDAPKGADTENVLSS